MGGAKTGKAPSRPETTQEMPAGSNDQNTGVAFFRNDHGQAIMEERIASRVTPRSGP